MSATRKLIVQGEWAVSKDADTYVSTVLGSCVACCLWDPVAKAGGMNHMLIAVSRASQVECNLAGLNAMELLINDILKLGAERARLRAKVFGGARMVSGLSDIGQSNIDFTLEFLANEGIDCESKSIGGDAARHVKFWPATGRVMQKISKDAPVEPVVSAKPAAPVGNELELF